MHPHRFLARFPRAAVPAAATFALSVFTFAQQQEPAPAGEPTPERTPTATATVPQV